MTIHELKPGRETLHGQYNRDMTPALVVEDGDTVVYETYDVGWGIEPPTTLTAPRKKFEPRDPVRDAGPCMIGPTYITGARAGDVLKIHIETLEPLPWGWTWSAGPGYFNKALNKALGVDEMPACLVRWTLDGDSWVNQHGHRVHARPFLGTLGLCPDTEGWTSAWPPRRTAGNTDCKALVAGTVLMLPIEVDGALVSLGDAHGAQGDGEVSGMAIECRMSKVVLRYEVDASLEIHAPRAKTPTGRVTLGAGETVEAAMCEALNEMLRWMMVELDITRDVALALASVAVDVRISQVVNGVVGVYAQWLDDAIF